MKKVLTITALTWKSAFRYRLFWVMAVLLVAAVVGLPMVLQDDGTAKGLTQILLTYTLTAVASLLGFATLWLSCGTLAKDVEECQMQVVSVKPIARWQIWLGKWLGILSLNAVLLALAGAGIFALLHWRASRLPASQQAVLRKEIFVSRATIAPPPMDFTPQINAIIKDRVKNFNSLPVYEQIEIKKQITAALEADYTEVPPGYRRLWGVDLHTLRDKVQGQELELRVKFHTANPNTNPDAQYTTVWIVGPTNSAARAEIAQKLPPDSFQEFSLPPNMLDDKGILWIEVFNPGDTSLTFPMDDGFALLYPESTFGINFIRGMTVIFCWLALLASIGLAAASYLSFPVAAFVSIGILIIGLSSGTVGTVVEQGTITGFDSSTSAYGHTAADYILVPIFRGALKIIKLVETFSPIDYLSSGRSITWGDLGLAIAQIVLLLGGFFCVLGIIFFTRRELATAQGTS
jgi:ABC-type transport system involved in multi-copper enzyme maturation permease subunit